MIKVSSLLCVFVVITSCSVSKNTNKPLAVSVPEPIYTLDTLSVSDLPEIKRYNASPLKLSDLLHTRLEVKFDWQKQYLYGKATLSLKPYFYATDSLLLDAKGMEINNVLLVSGATAKKLVYTYDKKKLAVKLDKVYLNTEEYTVFIDYVAKPNESESKGSEAITSDKGLYFINPLNEEKDKPQQIWTQGETESNSRWFPTIDKPNERMTQEIYITVDKKYVTLSNGLLASSINNADGTRTDYWKQTLPAAPYLTMMAIGDFAVVKDKWKNPVTGKDMQVNYYLEKSHEAYAKSIFGHTPEMIDFFSKKLGINYVWEKYAQVIVRDYVSGAMENTGAVIHGEFLQRTDRELLDNSFEDVISHELFHHWFGNLVTTESWSNLPLNESFATYGEYLWNEYKYGAEEADRWSLESRQGYLNEATRKKVNLIRFDYEDREDMFDGHSYNKGGQVLNMLRNYVGDDAFFASLKLYLETNKFTSVEIHNLRLAFEQVTGEDLNWFFNQWFLSSGHPELKIEHTYTDKKYTLIISQTQDPKTTPIFKLPIAIDIYVNGTVQRRKVTLEKSKEVIIWDIPTQPDLVNVDADKATLCTKKEEKTINAWAFQYKHGPKFLDRYEALTQLVKHNTDPLVQETLQLALGDKSWFLRAFAVKLISTVLTGANRSAIKANLIRLNSDKKSAVRAAAIAALKSNYEDADLKPIYVAALKDQSYSVFSEALSAIAKLSPAEALALARTYEKDSNIEVLTALAALYSQNGSDKNNDFFQDAAPKFKSFRAIGFAGYYSTFLKNCNDETINKGVVIFEKMAKDDNKWVKFYAQKGITDLLELYQKREEGLQAQLKSDTENGILKLHLKQTQEQKQKIKQIYDSVK